MPPSVRLHRALAALIAAPLALSSVACGGGSSPAAPSVPQVNTPTPTPTPAATPTPAPTPTPTPAPTPAPAADGVVRSARMRGANGHSAGGNARIVRTGNRYKLEFGGDFRIDSGSIDVYLSRSDDSPASGDLNLGNLQSLTGAQSYDMGSDDGSAYRYVMLWCRPFRVPIGVGELQ